MSEEQPRVPRRPIPRPEGMDAEFYRLAKETGRLHFQKCASCQTWRHLPRYMCAKCASSRWGWSPSSGRGTVYSWTVTRRALHPAFAEEVPFILAVIELDEGVRMVSRLEDCAPEDVRMGMPVEVFFREASEEIMLPYFRPAS